MLRNDSKEITVILLAFLIFITGKSVMGIDDKGGLSASAIDSFEADSGNSDVNFDVPFIAQAPLGNWDDPRQKDGCEEASVLMAMQWIQNSSISLQDAEKEIIAISDFEQDKWGEFRDTSAQDTADRIFKAYFGYKNVGVRYDIRADDIKAELRNGNLVIVPVDSRKLANPYYKDPGPTIHMFLIIGYDSKEDEFITNDPGTAKGAGYRYGAEALSEAVMDYPSGFQEPMKETRSAMIIVSKPSGS